MGIKEGSRAGNEVRRTEAWKRDPGVRCKSKGLKGKALWGVVVARGVLVWELEVGGKEGQSWGNSWEQRRERVIKSQT